MNSELSQHATTPRHIAASDIRLSMAFNNLPHGKHDTIPATLALCGSTLEYRQDVVFDRQGDGVNGTPQLESHESRIECHIVRSGEESMACVIPFGHRFQQDIHGDGSQALGFFERPIEAAAQARTAACRSRRPQRKYPS